MARVPGQASFIGLVISSFWTVFMLLVMIGGHLLMVLWAWEVFFENASIQELAELTHTPSDVLFGVMAMAVVSDFWAFFGSKKKVEGDIERARKRH
ncbi:MAG: hypothetical protein Q9M09_06490 [Mariprofundaceae bacterium]|nr:hypothetical protein [Mariprofundaceae bacterium]